MKKLSLLFAGLLLTASMAMADGSYGIAVNGTMYYAGTQNPNPGDPSFQEFMVLGLALNAGDNFQLYDPSGNDGQGAGWAVPLDGASVSAMSLQGDHYTCSESGCYDFYIKLKYNADQLYIGAGNCGSPQGTTIGGGTNPGGDPGTNPGTDPGTNPGGDPTEGNPRYYYKGYINGQDVEPDDATLFRGGFASLTVTTDAYVFVLYQVDGFPGVQYMCAQYTDGPSHATLLTNGNDKFHIGAGEYTLYLYDNGDNTLELSTEPIPGKRLADPQAGAQQAVENITVDEQIIKRIENGQVVIIRNGVRYNALGTQL